MDEIVDWMKIIFLLFASLAFSWSFRGHEIVAMIAETQLSNSTKEILSNFFPNSFIREAAWADKVANTNEFRFTKTYHYADLPDEDPCHYNHVRDCNGTCVVQAVLNYTSQLNTKLSNSSMNAIRFVIHFLGDIHQPMHTGK